MSLKAVVFPATHPISKVDAIIVLGGGYGERLELGLNLFHAGVAETLVLSRGQGTSWLDGAGKYVAQLCDNGWVDRDGDLHCVLAMPDNTKGEAQTFSKLAAMEGWSSIAVVTSKYHVTRSSILFKRCFGGDLHLIAAPAKTKLKFFVHENLAIVDALLLNRTCRAKI